VLENLIPQYGTKRLTLRSDFWAQRFSRSKNMKIQLNENDLVRLWNEYCDLPAETPCKLGDEIVFEFDNQPIATAVVSHIERDNKQRVFWSPASFHMADDLITRC
jgi:hypothetical protein